MRMLLTAGKSAVAGSDVFSTSLLVLITGIVVVFLMLIVLTLIIKLYGTIVYSLTQKGQKKKTQAAAPKPEVPAVQATKASPEPLVEEGISGDVVAAIAAAVYYTEGAPLSAIRSVRRAKSGGSRSAWGMAGVLDNTRPF